MRKINAAQNEHDEIVSLLPWYLNRTLDPGDASRVSAHVEHCAECQKDTQIMDVALDVAANRDVIYDASDARLTRLLDRIEQHEATRPKAPIGTRWIQRQTRSVREFFAMPGKPLALAAALVVAVLAGIVGNQLITPGTQERYDVRSDGTPELSVLTLSVQFDSAMSSEDVQSILNRADIAYAWRTDDAQRISIDLPGTMPVSDVAKLMTALKSQPGVSGVQTTTP